MTDIDKLIENICNAKYEYISYNKKKETTTIVSGYDDTNKRGAIAKAVYEWANTQLSDTEKDRQIGCLEAKCYAYEKIIENSNFAPMIIKEGERNDE